MYRVCEKNIPIFQIIITRVKGTEFDLKLTKIVISIVSHPLMVVLDEKLNIN